MTPLETTLVVVLVVLLSIFFILCSAVMVIVVQVLKAIKRVVTKAETTVDTVESAASEILQDTQGRLALFKLIRNIVKLTSKRKDK